MCGCDNCFRPDRYSSSIMLRTDSRAAHFLCWQNRFTKLSGHHAINPWHHTIMQIKNIHFHSGRLFFNVVPVKNFHLWMSKYSMPWSCQIMPTEWIWKRGFNHIRILGQSINSLASFRFIQHFCSFYHWRTLRASGNDNNNFLLFVHGSLGQSQEGKTGILVVLENAGKCEIFGALISRLLL